jgi:hypothetical protein
MRANGTGSFGTARVWIRVVTSEVDPPAGRNQWSNRSMVMMILGTSVGYNVSQIRPFLHSLSASRYSGELILFANGLDLSEFQCSSIQIKMVPFQDDRPSDTTHTRIT